MQKMISFLLLLVFVGTYSSLQAYPIFPRTLSDVYKAADHVVYGKVKRLIDVLIQADVDGIPPPPILHDGFAVFTIQEELKGTSNKTEIYIATEHSVTCPTPFYFVEGQELLLFLHKDGSEDFYWTHAMSYGGREVTPEEYLLYKEKLVVLQTILDYSNSEIQEKDYISWMISCIKVPLMHWDGIFELLNEKEDENRNIVSNPYPLTEGQKGELRQIIMEREELINADLHLINYIKKENDPQLLIFLTMKFKTTMYSQFDYVFTSMATKLIADLSQREDLIQLSKQIQEAYFSKEGEQLVEKFQALL
ncbi:hypothetical protein HX004_04625 [Myroides sp. 1354]|uniref:hypothetical protein n=1 Tax=unclassified Myroides TaxID=2642485 RepID=UPI002577ECFD|nr:MULTISPECIES: hypothetical protein [unclassified Myroides]MDM1044129.1 hypothetical protein [Myroides sp. R163-1]MDM1055064.1 hypothetical protein [Myroides sp. 1354]MDM1068361.1 hypothetical protein [Myroides sp. 1372]